MCAANKLSGTLVPSLGKLNLTLLVFDSNQACCCHLSSGRGRDPP